MAAITSLANTADTKYAEVVNDSDASATGINPENLKTLIHNIFIKVDEALAKTNTHTNDIQTTEEIQDIVGAMFTSNTETRIAATYVDGAEGAGKINLVVDDLDTDSNTTYAISVENGDNTDEEKIRITASTGGTDDIVLEAGTGLTIARDGDKITFTNTVTDTTYTVGDGGLTQNNFTNADHTKLNGISASADVTDATTVTAAGALMDSEVTNLSQVKAFDSSDYATAAQGSKADSAQQPPTEGAFANGDKTKLDAIANNANNYSISSDLLDEDNMATNSATKVPSQQSVKAYVDANSGGASALNDLSDVTYANGDLTINSLDKIVTSGNLTLDSGSTLNIDSNNGRIKLDKAGTTFAEFNSDGIVDNLTFANAGIINLKNNNSIAVHPNADSIAILPGNRGLLFVTEDATNAYTLSSYVRTNCPIQLLDLQAHGDTPANGYGAIYVNGDKLYFKTDGGTATDLTAGGGGTQEAIFNFSARWYTRYNYWYFPSTVYGHKDLNWRTSFNSTSFPQSWSATSNPVFVAPKAFTLTSFESYGNISLSGQSTVDCELALLKGTPSYGNAGSIFLSQVGTTRQMTHNTGRMVAMSQAVSGNQNASIAKGDILIPCFRRTSTVSSSFGYYEMNFNILGEYT